MIDTVENNGNTYPKFQTNGQASRFILPFAKEVLSGEGLDIGCMKKNGRFQDQLLLI